MVREKMVMNRIPWDRIHRKSPNKSLNPWQFCDRDWLVVSTELKNISISQNGNLPQIGVKITKYLKPPARNWFMKESLQNYP